ncbi:MAG: OmpA family protein [Cyclobacteriaceae bacterium]
MKRCVTIFLLLALALGATAQTEPIRLSIFFGGGSYYIDYEQVGMIHQAVDSIADVNKYQITIYSHTDNIGGKAYNEWLSMMRSRSVIEVLNDNEISEELIIIKDFGQEDPLYTNNDYRGRSGNRRVDLILWPVIL